MSRFAAALLGRRRCRHPLPPALESLRLEPRRMLDAALAELGIEAWESDQLQVASAAWTDEIASTGDTDVLTGAAHQGAAVFPTGDIANSPPDSLEIDLTRPVDENQVVELLLGFRDDDAFDVHQVEVDWGDGSLETFNLSVGSRFFGTTHQYLDDDPSTSAADDYQVQVRVTDQQGDAAADEAIATVLNVAPRDLMILPSTAIDENGIASLDLFFVDPGALDRHTVQVDWGDGATESFNLSVGSRFFGTTHQYLDDDPSGTSSDSYDVHVRIADDDSGVVEGDAQITVRNVPPQNLVWQLNTDAIDEGATSTAELTFDDPGSLDTHHYVIDWGDGSSEVGEATGRSLQSDHVYADNGFYTLHITLRDDDLGEATATTQLTVRNVDPELTGVATAPQVKEGEAFTLASLGAALSDPGFDNSANTFDPANGGETAEVFTSIDVDWGDGTPASTLAVVNRVSGRAGEPTVAEFDHAPHVYADDGLYDVRVRLADDDGGTVTRTFAIRVANVAPTLTLTNVRYEIDEGQLVSIPDLGTFVDPGFDNPLNTLHPSNGGETTESFSYSIDWGDGTPIEVGRLPVALVSGSPGVATMGSLAHEHLYVDNDRDGSPDNRYTVAVTLQDDDGGVHQQTLEVVVNNVNPTLQPLAATDLNAKALTTLIVAFRDPGQDEFEILVDWGDKLHISDPADRFVTERLYAGSTPQEFVLPHVYVGPPDPLHPAAPIVISVKIRDDDFATGTVIEPGESKIEVVVISNPGEGVNPVRIDTTPQVPRLTFPERGEIGGAPPAASLPEEASTRGEAGGAGGESKAANERFLELRIVYPDGTEGKGVRLKFQSLGNLPAIFRDLPDNRYKLYLVQPETNQQRLVIDVYVRNGRLIDPGDDSEGTRDRPPTDAEASRRDGESETDALRTLDATAQKTQEPDVRGPDPSHRESQPRYSPESQPTPPILAPPANSTQSGPTEIDDDLGLSSSAKSNFEARFSPALWAVVATPALRRQETQRALSQATTGMWKRLRRSARPHLAKKEAEN